MSSRVGAKLRKMAIADVSFENCETAHWFTRLFLMHTRHGHAAHLDRHPLARVGADLALRILELALQCVGTEPTAQGQHKGATGRL